MTPKQKAEELWWSYYSTIEHTLSEEYSPHESAIAKQCALIAVDEILKVNPTTKRNRVFIGVVIRDDISYWQQVKQEIEQL